jgi:hypothetical protein
MNVGFTGTRWDVPIAQRDGLHIEMMKLASEYRNDHVSAHSGDCVGADKVFHELAQTFSWDTVGHPPLEGKLRAFCKYDFEREPAPYLERNRHIVHMAQIMLACSDSYVEKPKGGTWFTIRYAVSLRKPVIIVFPDGSSKRV